MLSILVLQLLLGPICKYCDGNDSAHLLPMSEWCPLAQCRTGYPPACAEVLAQAGAWCFASLFYFSTNSTNSSFDSSLGLHA